MKIASVADVKSHLSAYLKATAEGPVVVTRNGKAVAALVAVTDEEELERLLLAHSPKLQAILASARRRIQEGKGVPHDEFWKGVADRNAKGKQSAKRRKDGLTKH
jgi:prevent-host-death family protein